MMALLQEDLSSSEDVKTPETNENIQEKGKDYAQEARNKAIALKQERERLAIVEAELNEYKSKEQKEIEKKKKDQGKYEELLQEKENSLLALQKEIETLKPVAGKYQEMMQKQLDDLTKKIPDGEKEFVQSLIDGKSHDQQLIILEKFAKQYTNYDPSASSSKSSNSGTFTKLTTDAFSKLSPDRRKEYMKASLAETGQVEFVS